MLPPHLIDTNIVLREQYPHTTPGIQAGQALRTLRQGGSELYVTAQNLIEFWNVATRPLAANGLGWDPARTILELRQILPLFSLATDHPGIFEEWQRIVVHYGVSGVQVHDARLVAVMHVFGISHILTFNTADFARYSGRITVVHPQDLLPSP